MKSAVTGATHKKSGQSAMHRAILFFPRSAMTFLFIQLLSLNSKVFLTLYWLSASRKSFSLQISALKSGGNCHRTTPSFSLSAVILEKNTSRGSAGDFNFLTWVINLLPLSETIKSLGVSLYHFENAS